MWDHTSVHSGRSQTALCWLAGEQCVSPYSSSANSSRFKSFLIEGDGARERVSATYHCTSTSVILLSSLVRMHTNHLQRNVIVRGHTTTEMLSTASNHDNCAHIPFL